MIVRILSLVLLMKVRICSLAVQFHKGLVLTQIISMSIKTVNMALNPTSRVSTLDPVRCDFTIIIHIINISTHTHNAHITCNLRICMIVSFHCLACGILFGDMSASLYSVLIFFFFSLVAALDFRSSSFLNFSRSLCNFFSSRSFFIRCSSSSLCALLSSRSFFFSLSSCSSFFFALSGSIFVKTPC